VTEANHLFGPQVTECGEVLFDGCFSPVFTVTDKPVVVRGFSIEEGDKIILEMAGGHAAGSHYEPVMSGCGCCISLTSCNNQIIIAVSGTYRLNRCICSTDIVSADTLVEYQTIETNFQYSGNNNMSCACNEGSQVSVTSNPNGSTTIVVDGVATIIDSGADVTAVQVGNILRLTVDGVPYDIENGPGTYAELIAILGYRTCGGATLPQGAQLAQCSDLPTTLPPNGPAGGSLTGTYPNPGLSPAAVVAATGFQTCDGTPIAVGAAIARCSDIPTVPAAPTTLPPNGPAGGSLTGTYPNPGLSPAAVVAATGFQSCAGADLAVGAIVAQCSDLPDYVGTGGAALADNATLLQPADLVDVSATVTGQVNNTSLQELGGTDKLINGNRVGRGASGDQTSTALGSQALGTNPTTAVNSVGVGANAGRTNTQSGLTAVGSGAAANNRGLDVVAVGRNAGINNMGGGVVAIGAGALFNNTGAGSVAGGFNAGSANTGANLVAFGSNTALTNTGANVVAVGAEAGRNNTGNSVVAVGFSTAVSNTGAEVAAVGRSAAARNTGNGVAAVGFNAASDNTGTGLAALGTNAGTRNAANMVVAVGFGAAAGNRGLEATAVGTSALEFNLEGLNTGVGSRAGRFNRGVENTSVGASTNSAFVSGATHTVTAVDPATGNITVTGHGYTTRTVARLDGAVPAPLATGNVAELDVVDANTLRIVAPITSAGGVFTLTSHDLSFSNSTALGFGAENDVSNQIVLGDSRVVSVETAGTVFAAGFTSVSDSRNKKFEEFEPEIAAEFSKLVSFKQFTMLSSFVAAERQTARFKETVSRLQKGDAEPATPTGQTERGKQFGVSAQEIQKLTEKLGAFQWLVHTRPSGELAVDYQSMYSIIAAGFQHRLAAAGI
jgi:hypothetical protein